MKSKTERTLTGFDTAIQQSIDTPEGKSLKRLAASRHIFDRTNKPFEGKIPKEWKPPATPFTPEGFAELFSPNSEESAKLLEEQIDELILEAQEGISPFWEQRRKAFELTKDQAKKLRQKDGVIEHPQFKKERWSIINKLNWHKMNLAIKSLKGQVQREQMRRFILWILGSPIETHRQKIERFSLVQTGNIESTEIREYLSSFFDAIEQFYIGMCNLLIEGPGTNLTDHMLYYKLFVEGDTLTTPHPFLSHFKEFFYQGLNIGNSGLLYKYDATRMSPTNGYLNKVIHPYIKQVDSKTSVRDGNENSYPYYMDEKVSSLDKAIISVINRLDKQPENLALAGTAASLLSGLYENVVQGSQYSFGRCRSLVTNLESCGEAKVKKMVDDMIAKNKEHIDTKHLQTISNELDKLHDIKEANKKSQLKNLTNIINLRADRPRAMVNSDDIKDTSGSLINPIIDLTKKKNRGDFYQTPRRKSGGLTQRQITYLNSLRADLGLPEVEQ